MSRIILPPWFILPPYHFAPYHFAPWKWFNDLHYLPTSHVILPPYHPPLLFCPLDSLCPLIIPPIVLPPGFILPLEIILPPPPGNRLMINTINSCLVSFCPLDSFCPHIILPPIILPPWKWFNDLHYFPTSHVILPPYHSPPIVLPPGFILPPGNDLLIYTIYPCPISILHYILISCIILPPLSFCPWKWFNGLHYFPMSHIILPPIILPPGNCLLI